MQRHVSILFCVLLFLIQGFVLHATDTPADTNNDPVKVSLAAEETSIQPERAFNVAITLNIDEHWHTYWKNPGDTGFPVEIEWDLPEGYTIDETLWPYPQRFDLASIIGYGYENQVSLISKITPGQVTQTPVTIKANVRWLACSDSNCLPGESSASITLDVTPVTPAINTETASVFSQARASLPKQQGDFQADRKDNAIHLHFNTAENYTQAYFCPEDSSQFDHKIIPTISSNDHETLLSFNDLTSSNQLKGVVVLSKGPAENLTTEAYDVDLLIADASHEINQLKQTATDDTDSDTAPGSRFEGGFGLALALAFLGGMILNLMPCVLPVISFKILSFVKLSKESRSLSIKHGCSFAFGVLLSFWILAGILLILQAYGRSVGWGFQLQEPIFVAALAAVIFIFGLSLFGIFEMGMGVASLAGQKKHSGGLWGSFFSGVLATAVATPCTGPFLGSAVGYAVTLPAVWSLLIFTSLGVGMAFPYLILAAYPKLLKFLPKPGPWMSTFKEIMGFLMMATVMWLIWVFGAQTPMIALMMLLVALFFFALGCWVFGKWGTPVNKRGSRILSYLFLAGCLIFGGELIWTAASLGGEEPDTTIASVTTTSKHALDIDSWEPYSPERVKELHAQGIPVLVDFTAKWCLICQANHLVLSTPEVSKKLHDVGVVKMKADWTRKDAMIAKQLRKFGRSGVPLYLLYDKDPTSDPYILPQVLTPDFMLKALKELGASKSKDHV